jgi:hypothetical protein
VEAHTTKGEEGMHGEGAHAWRHARLVGGGACTSGGVRTYRGGAHLTRREHKRLPKHIKEPQGA